MEYKLEDVCDFFNGGAWSESEYVEKGIPVVKVSNIKGNDIIFDQINYIGTSSLKKYAKNILNTDDVVIATVGSHPSLESSAAGRSVIIPKKIDGYLLNQNAVCLRTKDNDILNQKYLGYLAETQAFKNFIQNRGGGAANQMRIPIGAIKSYKIKIPENQKKIAKILSNYDNIIENNLIKIKLLEEKARITYEEWFLRFRIDGKKLDIAQNTGLPLGWKKKALSNFIKFKKGKSSKEIFDNYKIGLLPLLSLDSLESKKYNYVKEEKQIIALRHDILMLMDGARSSLVVYSEKGAVGSTLALIETKKIPSSLLFHYLKVRFELLQVNNTGAAIPHANKSFINKMEIIVPVDEVLLKWEEIINSINEEIYNLEDQNKLLKESRDILLPRLMTGMIDVDKMDIEV
jgi:type I restriction enzyme, S subunit